MALKIVIQFERSTVFSYKYEFIQVHHPIERNKTAIELRVKNTILESPNSVPSNFCVLNYYNTDVLQKHDRKVSSFSLHFFSWASGRVKLRGLFGNRLLHKIPWSLFKFLDFSLTFPGHWNSDFSRFSRMWQSWWKQSHNYRSGIQPAEYV